MVLPEAPSIRRLHFITYALIAAVILISGMVLAGWIFDIQVLKNPFPFVTANSPTTAVLFIILCISTLLASPFELRKGIASDILSAFVVLASFLRLAGLKPPFALDMALFDRLFGQIDIHMSSTSASCFILAGMALLIRRHVSILQTLALLILIITFFCLLGYLNGVPEFRTTLAFVPMSLPFIICFTLVAIVLFLQDPTNGWFAHFTSALEGARIARAIMPLVILGPAALGLLRLRLTDHLSTELGVTLLVTAIIWMVGGFISYTIYRFNERDIGRRHLEEVQKTLNQQLAKSVSQESAAREALTVANVELQSTNDKLMKANAALELANKKISEQTDIIVQQHLAARIQSEQNLHIVFANTQEGILVLDIEGRIMFFNHIMEHNVRAMTGLHIATGMYGWEATISERKAAAKSLFESALKGNTTELEVEYTLQGNPKISQLRYSPVWVDKEVRFVTVMSVDITDKKSQQRRLEQSEMNLRTIFDNTVENFTLIDANLNIIAFNNTNSENVRRITGRELHVGESLRDSMSPDRYQQFASYIEQARHGQPVTKVASFGAPSGEIWYQYSIRAIKNNNSVTGFCITANDITAIKKAEAEILRLNKELSDFESAIHRSSIVSVADPKGNITFVNDNFVNISGYSREELMGQNHRLINSSYHPKSFWINMWRTISKGEIWRARVKNKRKNGTFYWVDTFVMPFTDEQGKVRKYLSIRNDISATKEAEDELLQKRMLLEEASRIAKIGYWVIDTETQSAEVSPELLSLFDVTHEEYQLNSKIFYERIWQDDLDQVPTLQNIATWKGNDQKFRIRDKQGHIHWLNQKLGSTLIIAEGRKVIGTVQDITEQKESERILKEYNERFEILLRATQDAIYDLNILANTIVWNPVVVDIFGYTPALDNEEGPYRWSQMIHSRDRDRVLDAFRVILQSRSNTWTISYRLQCADGQFKHVLSRSYIMYNDEKLAVRAIGSLQDITDRVHAMKEVEKLSLVASKTNNRVIIINDEGKVEWVNESFERSTGYKLSDVKNKSATFLLGPDTDPSTVERVSAKLRRREVISEEILNYTITGEKIWLKADIAPVFDDGGELKNFIVVLTDITELKDFEKSITAVARELSSLIDNASVPIFGVDQKQQLNEWNGVAAHDLGYTKSEVIGRDWNDILHITNNYDELRTLICSCLAGSAFSGLETSIITKSGKSITLLLSASPRRNTENEIVGLLIVGQNITELSDYRNNLERKVEERTLQLHEALAKEKELVQLKNQFVSIASHEFRTPLTTISIAAGFIRKYKEKVSAQQLDEKLISIEKQVANMTFLLDDILMIGKAESGKLTANLTPLELIPFIEGISSEVSRATMETHRIVVKQQNAYKEIVTDEKLLRNIIVNVLTNAVKFSPEANQVDVIVSSRENVASIRVKDYGIGIAPDYLKNLFEPFHRGVNAASIPGTGLGLSIIKRAVDVLGGHIEVTSELGVGTDITIELPT